MFQCSLALIQTFNICCSLTLATWLGLSASARPASPAPMLHPGIPHRPLSAALPQRTLAWMRGWQGLPLPPLTLLDLQLHEAVSDLLGMGFAVLPPGLHGVAAVVPAVLQRQVHHHDVKGTVVVGEKLHPVMAGLLPEGGFLGAVARQLVVPARVAVQLLFGDIADVLLLGAVLVAVAAEVPGFVEQVVAVGEGTADPAGQGDVLALGADAERVRGGDQESCWPSCRGEGTAPESDPTALGLP